MKAPVGLLSDRTVLRSKMEGLCPDKFAFAKRSAAMKSPVGTLSDRTVLRSKMEGLCPDKLELFHFKSSSKASISASIFFCKSRSCAIISCVEGYSTGTYSVFLYLLMDKS